MTSKPQIYRVGVAVFRSSVTAARVTANRSAFAAAVNREGMTAEEREAAFKAFFTAKSEPDK